MKKIEARDNDFIVHFKEMLKESFPKPLDFRVDYYVGEDDKGARGLYFHIESIQFGTIFSRFHELKPEQVVYDIEEEFINRVINDLVIAGVTIMNVKAFETQANDRLEKELKSPTFRNIQPRRLLFIN